MHGKYQLQHCYFIHTIHMDAQLTLLLMMLLCVSTAQCEYDGVLLKLQKIKGNIATRELQDALQATQLTTIR